MPRVISPPRRQVCGNFGRRHPDASHHHHSSFRRSAGRSTGCGRAALAIRTTLELGIEFGVLQTGADLLSGKPAKSTTAPCSSRAARVDRDGVLGATRSFNVPGNHTARGAAALHRPRAPSAARSSLWWQISGCTLAADQPPYVIRRICGRPADTRRVRGVLARARPLPRPRAPPVRRARRLRIDSSAGSSKHAPNMQNYAAPSRRPRSSSLRAGAAAFEPGVLVHVAAGPATAIATTAATLATQSCSARLDGQ